ncbi:Threonine synthase [Streptomyces sp. YIM 130001]|uniref:threonine synthase n=1 Tax=Streptomyces sp. YIM 130001 TaxID=2259644 RepID=UPI000E655AA5|nr:pyridoxal-phosphate dependent enzyme [Streptomyces sp. YIM 130001]RII18446.1 Threonine synthase [Streptomyces sp. YIM 130001]
MTSKTERSNVSLATVQRSLGDPAVEYPLWPPLTRGCPRTSTETMSYPVEVDYDYARVEDDFLSAPRRPDGDRSRGSLRASSGHDRWAALLPPLLTPGLGEGGTPLVELDDGVFVKDESRNPTWSHKDRLNRVTASAAKGAGAPGIVVASSGNHGASAAAYAARAGLRCVILSSAGAPPAVASMVDAYGAVVLPVPVDARWPLAERIADTFGFHPASNLTRFHTGHAWGPEGYKTVAYEIAAELGAPGSVFVPTGYGELLFGVWKGFTELHRLGLVDRVPRVFSCEPAAGGPLAAALGTGAAAARVELGPTAAYSIGCPVGGHRGVLAMSRGAGRSLLVDDPQMRAAQRELADAGLWFELSSAAGLAGLRGLEDAAAVRAEGPAVCIATSSGFKDRGVGERRTAPVDPEWGSVERLLREAGIGA